MLNPFAIEKEILQKTAALSDLLVSLKVTLASSVLSKVSSQYRAKPSEFVKQCRDIVEAEDESLKLLYVCKVCGKDFNEGRKLGGHVSRAHKGGSQSYLSSSQSSFAYEPTRYPSRRGRREQLEYAKHEEEGTSLKGRKGQVK